MIQPTAGKRHHAGRFRDLFFNQDRDHVLNMAFGVIKNSQHNPAATMAGLALCLILLCRRYNMNPRDALEMGGQVFNSMATYDITGCGGGVIEYMKHELPDI